MAAKAHRILPNTQLGNSLLQQQRVVLGVDKMKKLAGGFLVSLGIVSSSVSAEIMLNVNGTEYTLTALMENCQSMVDKPEAQIACFGAVSKLVEQQSPEAQSGNAAPTVSAVSTSDALEALRNVAEYQDNQSGLIIQGSECKAQIIYYANYFHVSRRNVSSMDLFSTRFDASEIANDKTVQSSPDQAHMSKGYMRAGSVAEVTGNTTIDSAQYNIAPKPGRMAIADYAVQVVDQLEADENNEFAFVLVHPEKNQSSGEIWNAFDTYVDTCQS